MNKIKSFLKYLIIGITIVLLISCLKINLPSLSGSYVLALTPTNIAKISPDELRINAQSLTNQGHKLLEEGNPEAALQTWQEAMDIYTDLGYEEGIIGSQINQSLALQALGQYRKACNLLLIATKLDYQNGEVCKQPQEIEEDKSKNLKEELEKQDNSPVIAIAQRALRVIALRNLGDVLRLIGNLDKSELVLQRSIDIATKLDLSSEISANQLSLGNTKYALYKQKLDLSDRTDLSKDRDKAIDLAKCSLDLYEKINSNNISSLKITKTQAKLNQLSLLLDMKDWFNQENSNGDNNKLKDELKKINYQIPFLVNELLAQADLFSDLPAISGIYSRLNFALSLQQLQQDDKLSAAIQYAKDGLEKAIEIENKSSEAYAEGILGQLYQKTDEKSAKKHTEYALHIAQSIQALDIAYQWQYQLGQIYEKRGEMGNAIAAYNGAVNTLDLVRKDLISINPDVQFSFRENVKPVYEELMGLLLLSQLSQDNLKQITEVNGKLQLAELENYMRCGSLNLKSIDEVTNPPDAIINTIVLEKENKLTVIVSLPKQIKQYPSPQYYYYEAPLNEVNEQVNSLQAILQDKNLKTKNQNRDILPYTQKLYKLLIAPAKSYLPAEGTLVFVLDSALQNIPMALLQDENKHYLIEKYSISLSFGSRLQQPKQLSWKESNALIAGVRVLPYLVC